jgi:capsid protein
MPFRHSNQTASDGGPADVEFAAPVTLEAVAVGAAQAAADYAVILKTAAPPDSGPAEIGEDGAAGEVMSLETERSMAVFCPEGWEPHQMRAEQPATTYPDFKREVLSEIARRMGMPYNIAACDSSTHNYASGRLDDLLYRRNLGIEAADLAARVLDQVLAAWLLEARAAELLPAGAWTEEGDPHQWMWPGLEESDPRWVSAEAELVGHGLLSEARYYARRGYDWEAEMEQRSREMKARAERGLPQPWDRPAGAAGPGAGARDDDDEVPVGHGRRARPNGRRGGPAGGNGDS